MADDATPAPGTDDVPIAAQDAAAAAPPTETPTVPPGGDPVGTAPAAEASAPAVGEAPLDAKPEATDEVPKTEPSLLDKFDADKKADAEKPADEKPVEAKPEEKPADAPADEKPADEADKGDKPEVTEPDAEKPALEAVDYFADLELPEGIKPSDDERAEITKVFDEFRADPKAGAKGLIDLHTKQMNALQERLVRGQWDAFNDTRKGWVTEVMADPILGGAGHQTAMGKVAMARDAFISNAVPGTPAYQAELAEWDSFCAITGAGDHPAFLRMLHNASRYVREGGQPPPNGGVPKDIAKNPGRRGKLTYDNPTSNPE